MRAIADRAEQLLGTAVVSTTPVPGGDICTATKLRLSDGRSALVKTRPRTPPGFFESEAAGLRWLAEAHDVAVAEVLAVAQDCLILGWVEPARATPEAATRFGEDLARLHAASAGSFGREEDGFIGSLPLPNRDAPTWPEFYATRRVLPYLQLAVDRGHVDSHDRDAVQSVVGRIVDLAGPEEHPARLHGDLWSGNVVWTTERAVLIDPAAHGGHRETDLAMLSLFGLPHLQRTLDAYAQSYPLAEGWRERQPLHQLFPLLVHAALFGGGYGRQAGEAARRLLR